jgi:hypothetical protein
MNGAPLVVAARPGTCLPLGLSCSLRYMRRFGWVGAVALVGCVVWGGVVRAQTATTMVEVPVPLLPQSVAGVSRSGDVVAGVDPAQADVANAQVLHEDGLQRFARATYGRTQVEALQFNDATGAYSAFTLYLKNGVVGPKLDEVAQDSAIVDGRTIVLAHTVVLVAEKSADDGTLMHLIAGLPKVSGPRNQPPLLPTLLPSKGIVLHSPRYAIGPESYAAMGGTLPVAQLGWEKSAEAVTAQYADKRGKETLTLLLYPTPQIAGEHSRLIEMQVGSAAKVRREGELVIVAAGSFNADDTQNMEENIHLRSQVTFDKTMPLDFQTEVHKTYSLLASIAVFSGVGALAAVLLGVFLGGGRALVRKMQGKDAATDAEFLSLHLDPQNPRPKFDPPAS